jgi:hypothetical protein
MGRPDYLNEDDDFQGVVKAERNKILRANRNAAQNAPLSFCQFRQWLG